MTKPISMRTWNAIVIVIVTVLLGGAAVELQSKAEKDTVNVQYEALQRSIDEVNERLDRIEDRLP